MVLKFEMEEAMLQRYMVLALFAASALGLGNAQSNAPTTLNQTAATSGKQMYLSYCASCHGVDGRGHGPVASSLKMLPADLTLLSRKNNGKFPDAHIDAILQYGPPIPSHGTAEMPVWGPILGKLDKANPEVKQIRISNLTQYLKSIQAN